MSLSPTLSLERGHEASPNPSEGGGVGCTPSLLNTIVYTPSLLHSFSPSLPKRVVGLPLQGEGGGRGFPSEGQGEAPNNLKTLFITMNKTLKFILEMAIAVLTAILTTLGVTSCM